MNLLKNSNKQQGDNKGAENLPNVVLTDQLRLQTLLIHRLAIPPFDIRNRPSRIPRLRQLTQTRTRDTASTSTYFSIPSSISNTPEPTELSMAAPAAHMPFRGHASAPKYEGNNPRELRRYFEELDFLFTTCAIVDDAQKKQFAVRYVDIDTEDGWKQLQEYDTGTYAQFKSAVLKLYPGADGERKWTIADLDALTGEWSRMGFRNKEEFGDYHCRFLIIVGFLKSKNRMSDNEIKRAFVRGFPMNFWNKVLARLQIKKPDVHPDDPWDVEDVYAATEFVLHGTTSAFSAPSTTTNAPQATANEGDSIKKEDLFKLFEQFSQTITKALERKAPPTNTKPSPPQRPCFYDGGDHLGRNCEKLKEDIKNGLCKRDADNKIILPDGSWIARSLRGNNMAERVANWNKDNPGRANASVNLLAVFDGQPTSPQYSANTYAFHETQSQSRSRIDELEREVYELRKRQVLDAVEVPRPQRASQRQAPSRSQQETSAPPANKTTSKPQDKAPAPAVEKSNEKPNVPSHPYASVPENSYLPPHERNFGTKFPKDKDIAYRTTAPIQSPTIVNDVFSKTMRSQCVTLSPEEILSITQDVRSKVHEVITSKHVFNKPNQPVALQDANDIQDTSPFAHIDDEETASSFSNEKRFTNATPPPGALVLEDPFETYLQNMPNEDIPKNFKVAKDSLALRSIHMRVNFRDNIECVVDPGSSIVSMSEAVALHLCLSYDPTIYIRMESANGSMDRTLGLARHVHCKVAGINVYLQIHIMRNPAYDILLGRPFDVLTRSTVHNFTDGNQTITIHDPNSGYVATIPTFQRNRPRFVLPSRKSQITDEKNEEDQDFH